MSRCFGNHLVWDFNGSYVNVDDCYLSISLLVLLYDGLVVRARGSLTGIRNCGDH